MYRIMDIPATRYDREVTHGREAGTSDLSGIILWVGVDAHAVDAIVNGASCIEGVVSRRLRELLDSEEISISKEYTVTASVTVTCTVEESIEAQSESAAADLMHDRISEGEVDGLFDDHTIDDIDVTDIEVY
jgi:hypothetical protein